MKYGSPGEAKLASGTVASRAIKNSSTVVTVLTTTPINGGTVSSPFLARMLPTPKLIEARTDRSSTPIHVLAAVESQLLRSVL